MEKLKDGRLNAKFLNTPMERKLKILKFMLYVSHTPLKLQVIIKI